MFSFSFFNSSDSFFLFRISTNYFICDHFFYQAFFWFFFTRDSSIWINFGLSDILFRLFRFKFFQNYWILMVMVQIARFEGDNLGPTRSSSLEQRTKRSMVPWWTRTSNDQRMCSNLVAPLLNQDLQPNPESYDLQANFVDHSHQVYLIQFTSF